MWVEWNEEGRFQSRHDEPAIGRSLIMSPLNRFFSWQTTSITEIVEQREDYIKFNTLNSVYELWKIYQDHWCEHKPSITVYVGDDEWMEVGAWVYKNISILSGVSFLPRDNGSYRQAPYEEIDEAKYNELLALQNVDINWVEFMEETDTTTSAKELACTAGACEI